jgi:hypothetical protein
MSKRKHTRAADFNAYCNAADRIRRSEPQPMDAAVCEWWGHVLKARLDALPSEPPRSIYDLPVARSMYEADRSDMESRR